jgi:uncharacterized membrane protein YccC
VENPIRRKHGSESMDQKNRSSTTQEEGISPLFATSLAKKDSAHDHAGIVEQIRENPRLRNRVINALVKAGHLLHEGEEVKQAKRQNSSLQKIRGSYTWLHSDLTKKMQKVQRAESKYNIKERLETKLETQVDLRRKRAKSTSRQDYEQVLEDIIGPEPPLADQDWRADWASLTKAYSGSVEEVRSLEQWIEWKTPLLDSISRRGFSQEEAQVIKKR